VTIKFSIWLFRVLSLVGCIILAANTGQRVLDLGQIPSSCPYKIAALVYTTYAIYLLNCSVNICILPDVMQTHWLPLVGWCLMKQVPYD
jgi:hypothetical protein